MKTDHDVIAELRSLDEILTRLAAFSLRRKRARDLKKLACRVHALATELENRIIANGARVTREG